MKGPSKNFLNDRRRTKGHIRLECPVFLGFLVVVAGVGILITGNIGNIINNRLAGQLRTFDKDLTEAKATELGYTPVWQSHGTNVGIQKDAYR
jgi:hypothetical protein